MGHSRAANIVARARFWTQQGRLQRRSLYLRLSVPASISSTNGYIDRTTTMVAVPAAAGTAFSISLTLGGSPCKHNRPLAVTVRSPLAFPYRGMASEL